MSDKLQFPVVLWKASMMYPTCGRRRPPQESHARVRSTVLHSLLVRSGYFSQVWWAIIISMRYCTGCGGGFLKEPQALCEFDRPFVFSTVCVCSLGRLKKKRQATSSDDKSLPSEKTKTEPKKKISCQHLKKKLLQKQTLTFTTSFISFILFALPTKPVLVTKVSLGFWEVILYRTAQKKKKKKEIERVRKKKLVNWWENHLESHFWGNLWRSKLLPPSNLTTQVQTVKCYRERQNKNDAFAMCDSIVHVLQIYSYLVVHSDIFNH